MKTKQGHTPELLHIEKARERIEFGRVFREWTICDSQRREIASTTSGIVGDDLKDYAELFASAPKLKEDRDALLEAAHNIVVNAVIGPDASMKGLTDCYQVPLDDIETLRAAIAKAEGDR